MGIPIERGFLFNGIRELYYYLQVFFFTGMRNFLSFMNEKQIVKFHDAKHFIEFSEIKVIRNF